MNKINNKTLTYILDIEILYNIITDLGTGKLYHNENAVLLRV